MDITGINSQTQQVLNANRRAGKNELGKDAFLQMLVTQLRNQDPTNPLDSTQFAAQLAQFNTLEQLINLNERFDAMAQQQEVLGTGMTNTLAASLTGKTVRVQTDQVAIIDGVPPKINFSIAGSAATVEVQILDANNQVIRTEKFRNLDGGDHTWNWNGRSDVGVKAPDGKYRVLVTAKNGETDVPHVVYSEGIATRLRYSQNGVQLQVNGIFVNLSSVEQIGV
jgi:flagellar basal-body rod modification protein FlgD